MPAKKKDVESGLEYKGKPLLRRGNLIYYGNADDKYIITLLVQDAKKIMDLDVATNVLIQLQTNEIPGREKIIKKAERDGLYSALDLAEFWLEDALSEEK